MFSSKGRIFFFFTNQNIIILPLFLEEVILPLSGEIHIRDADFPSFGHVPADFGAHGAGDDLVPEADAYELDAGVGEDRLDEGDEGCDPGGGGEGVIF